MNKLRSTFVFALLLALILSYQAADNFVFAQTNEQAKFTEKIKRIEKFVETQMKSEGTVGLTIGFVKDDFRWVKGFGLADLENKIPTKPESSYRMASVTKPMTAVGILILVEQGKIDLDAEVQKYVPYFPKKKYPVTIRQLLGHLGGISHYRNYDLEGHFKEHKNTRDAISVFEDFDLVSEPGTHYSYTSYGFNLLGAVIEGASGKPYGEYMTENVWGPLGMNETLLDDPLEIIPNRVKGYQLIDREVRNSEFVDMSSRFAAGGIRSTVPDMLDFAKGLYEGKLLTTKMRNEMWTTQTARDGFNTGYGYGWGTRSPNGRFMVDHSGSQAETKTYLLTIPNEKFAAAVAINFEGANPTIYLAELFRIIFVEAWQIRYYSNDEKDGIALRGMDIAFDEGMRFYSQFGMPMTRNEDQAKESFAYLKEALNSDTQKMRQSFESGSHPISKSATARMISIIADKLKQDGKNLDIYYKNGVIPMLSDYVKWYKTQPNYSEDLKFERVFEQKIATWNTDWAKVWNKDIQNFEIHAEKDMRAFGEKLNKAFAGMSVYPDYVNDLNDAVTNLAVSGDIKRAFQIAEINYKLYPESSTTNATIGVLHVLNGQKDVAMSSLKKSLALNPQGNANAGSLNAMAYDLQNIGQAKAGLQLLLIAIELHPKVANLFDSAAEFYSNSNENNKASEYYRKALEVDPNYPNAKKARDFISEPQK